MSAKTISSLAIRLGGDVNPLATAFGKADTMVARFGRGLASFGRNAFAFTGIASAIGALTGGAGIGLLVKNQLEAVDSSSKLAARLGIATESLVGFEHAANLAGLSSEQLSNGLGFLMKNLGKAAEGADETGGAFGQLGLNVNELMRLAPDEVFMRVADSIAEIQNPIRRAYMATQIFGRSGQQLLPLLMQGSKGLREATKEATALGLSFSKIDGERIEEANDSITRFKMTFVGIGRTFAVAIAPFLDQTADKFTAWGIKAVAAIKTITPRVMELAARIGGSLSQAFANVWGKIVPASSAIQQWTSRNQQAMVVVAKMAAGIAILRIGIPLLATGITRLNAALLLMQARLLATNVQLNAMVSRYVALSLVQGRFGASMTMLAGPLKSLGKAGLLGIAVATLVAFGTVVFRQITTNEKWSDSCLKMARSVGIFKGATTNFGLGLEEFGKTGDALRQAQFDAANAKTADAQFETNQNLLDALEARIAKAKELRDLQNASGKDAGITSSMIDKLEAESERVQELIQAEKDRRRGVQHPDLSMPEMPDFGDAGAGVATPITPETPAIIDQTRSAIDNLNSGTLTGIQASDLFKDSWASLTESWKSGAITAAQYNQSVQQLLDGFAASQQKIKTDALDNFNDAMSEIADQIFALNHNEIDIKVREFAKSEGVTQEQIDQYRAGLKKLETEREKFANKDAAFDPLESLKSSIDTGPSLLEAGSAEAQHLHAKLAAADRQIQSLQDQPEAIASTAQPSTETADLTNEVKMAMAGPKSERAILEKQLKVASDSLNQLKEIAGRNTVELQLVEV